MPIYMSTSFVFDSTEHAAELYSLRSYGNIYTRISNPTVAAFEEKMASLEGGLGAVAASSGHAAQVIAIFSLAQAGDHLVASSNLYGGSVTQFSVSFKRLGIDVTFVPGGEPAGMRAAIKPNTKALFVETISKPSRPPPTRRACLSSSITPLPRPTCAGRSNTVPTSSYTPARSSSAATAR